MPVSKFDLCDVCEESEAVLKIKIGSDVSGKSCIECEDILKIKLESKAKIEYGEDWEDYEVELEPYERRQILCDSYLACIYNCEDMLEMSVQMCFSCHRSYCFGGACKGATIEFL